MSEIENNRTSLNFSDIPLKTYVEEIVTDFIPQAEKKGLQLDFSCISSAEIINTDQQKLKFILINLISNALKFTDTGSVHVEYSIKDNDFTLKVTDTGIGVAPEYINEIFIPFFQVDRGYERKYRGNGLGLAICKSYIDMLHGSISFESTGGDGSTFTVRFPVTKKEPFNL